MRNMEASPYCICFMEGKPRRWFDNALGYDLVVSKPSLWEFTNEFVCIVYFWCEKSGPDHVDDWWKEVISIIPSARLESLPGQPSRIFMSEHDAVVLMLTFQTETEARML